MRIFLQYLQPLLTYGCPIWGMAAQTHLREPSHPEYRPQNDTQRSTIHPQEIHPRRSQNQSTSRQNQGAGLVILSERPQPQ
ncbi:hypothetical protein TNCT_188561 [Trichonephila clavata]|uniref:Uncharacterized protein n=1 Tax=Trichonephila clavata TaxID=2740835 RepID=A0A8X6LQR3_TRICU|nr:hypothetical protein TNCT_188561 [Trichonephila clavata]